MLGRIVLRLPTCGRVGFEDGPHAAVRGDEPVEEAPRRVIDEGHLAPSLADFAGVEFCVATDQTDLKCFMNPMVAGHLPVVVLRGVKRHVEVGRVVRERAGLAEDLVRPSLCQRVGEPGGGVGGRPRRRAMLLQRLLAELLLGFDAVAREV